MKGSYSYTGADGRRYRVRYTADELGFHPITELEFDVPDVDNNAARQRQVPKKSPTARPTQAPKKNPFSQSNFLNNRYLPPSNDYLPPSNEYLPPSNDFTNDLQAPFNSV